MTDYFELAKDITREHVKGIERRKAMPSQNDAVRQLADAILTATFDYTAPQWAHERVEHIIRDAIRPLLAASYDVRDASDGFLYDRQTSDELQRAIERLQTELPRWKEQGT